MSTTTPAEASVLPAKAQSEKAPKNPKSEPDQATDPAENGAARPLLAVTGSPSPADTPSEGEYSKSENSETRDADTTDNKATETQPPLPNEPLPGQPPLPNEPLPDENTAPPLPNEPLLTDPAAPPLPAEPVPEPEDDGWEFHWNPNDQSYWFYNRFTGIWQQENPRVPAGSATSTTAAPAPSSAETKTALSNPTSIAGGYNPAIHGDYDENAWYAQNLRTTAGGPSSTSASLDQQTEDYTSAAFFNRRTGQWQTPEQGAERHSDEAKARRQMRAYFDVDAAANMHDGRSLKAERAGIKPSRSELKAFKERRRQKKEEKRRAWLRD
ncbi:hypothetical protein VTI74DRAFT_10773 [Chaetomium olivicolor]